MDARPAAERSPSPGRRDRESDRRSARGGVRFLTFVLLVAALLIPALGRAADLLLLAPTSALGPNVERDRVLQPNWILWPKSRAWLEGLLPLTTGVDLSARDDEFLLRSVGDDFTLLSASALSERGLFAARRAAFGGRRLVPLAGPSGAVPREAIVLCATGADPVRPATAEDLRDPNVLIVATAARGDAVRRARELVSGRVVLIETPAPGQNRSRFYLYGPGWPKDGVPIVRGVPGLVPAREIPRLLTRPGSFRWTPSEPLLYREADRWLDAAGSDWPVWGLVVLSLAAGGFALVEVTRDRKTIPASLAAWGVLAIPVSVLRSPSLAGAFGPSFAPLAVLVLLAALIGGAWLVYRIWEERSALAFLAAIGVVSAGWAGPFHPWSGVLRDLPLGRSPHEIGAAALYAAVGIAATRDGQGALWLLVRLANLAALGGLLLRAPENAFAVPLAWAAGMSALPANVFPALVALPEGLSRLVRDGLTYRPHEIAHVAPVAPGVNLWSAGAFFLSGPTLLFGFAVGFAAMMSTSYAGYRIRRATGGPGRAGLVAALGLGAACVLTPDLWPGVLVAAAGALPLFVADAR